MPDLSTTYLGLTLANPLVVSASPLSAEIDNLRRMEDAGAGAVVLHSLFEEQITLESLDLDQQLANPAEAFPEALTYFPEMTTYNLGPEGYLEHIRRAKAAILDRRKISLHLRALKARHSPARVRTPSAHP